MKWRETDSGREIAEAVMRQARAVGVYDPAAVLDLRGWGVVQTTRTLGGFKVTPEGEDQISRGLRDLSADRPDLFRELPKLAPREARDVFMRLVREGRREDAVAFRARHAGAIEAADAQVRRETNAAEADERARTVRRDALDLLIASRERDVSGLRHSLDHVERTGEWQWNGMGQPPPAPTPRAVQDMKDRWALAAAELLDLQRQRSQV